MHNQSGVIKILPVFVIVAAVGVISFLLISSTVSFRTGLFGNLFPKTSLFAATNDTSVSNLTLASTYESISVYTTFSGDLNSNNTASLKWRKVGDVSWKAGMDMVVDRRTTLTPGNVQNPYVNQWRASVIGLTKNTPYEIQVTFADTDGVTGTNPITQTTTTRNDQYPSPGTTFYVAPTGLDTNAGTQAAPFKTIQHGVDTAKAGDTVLVKAGTYPEMITFNPKPNSDVNHFLTVKNFGTDKPIIDSSNLITFCGFGIGSGIFSTTLPNRCGMDVMGSFIHIAGFEFVGGETGIKVDFPRPNLPPGVTDTATHDIIIDNNLIHNLKFSGTPSVDLLIGNSNAEIKVSNITIQNNILYAAPGDPNYGTITFQGTQGGHVIRNNKMYFQHQGTAGVHGSDCVTGIPNTTIFGGQNKDTDIYNNYCEGATDDAYSLDGGGMNERVWNNVAYKSNTGVSIAPTMLGPTYIYRNVFHDLQFHWTGCLGLKNGEAGTGFVYIYHNTFEVSDINNFCTPPTGLRRSYVVYNAGSGAASANLIFKNNILHGYDQSIILSQAGVAPTIVFDYNLHHNEITYNGRILEFAGKNYGFFHTTGNIVGFVEDTGQEKHGFYITPTYVASASADFHLKVGSPGINQGSIIPGFNDSTSPWPLIGPSPDIGTFESGSTSTPSPNPSATANPTATPTPTLAPTPVPTPTPLANVTVSGTVFNDANGNGVLNAGEVGVGSSALKINNSSGVQLASTTSAGSGAYTMTIPRLTATDTVILTVPTGFINTTPSFVTFSSTANFSNNFGIRAVATPSPAGKVGDLDNDGDVDIFDYSTLIANFGKTGTNILGDLDNDGDVDIFDYSTLVGNFGK